MACSFPIKGYRTASGKVVFAELKKHGDQFMYTEVPCGQCARCRESQAQDWSLRCMQEAALHKHNCFVTLTYEDEHLPPRGQLRYKDFQLFIRYLRRYTGRRIRYFVAGEYGERNNRPHFHALLFDYDFPDKTPGRLLASGMQLYTSALASKCWRNRGFVGIGSVTPASASYCVGYLFKRRTGAWAEEHYKRVDDSGEYSMVAEFASMSRKPGIGLDFAVKYAADIFPRGSCEFGGMTVPLPKYYVKKFKEAAPHMYEEYKASQEARAEARSEDNTEERLIVKDAYCKAKRRFKERIL